MGSCIRNQMELHNLSVVVFYNLLTTAQAVEGTILDKWQVITPLDTNSTFLVGRIMGIKEVYKVCLPTHGYRGLVLKRGSGFEFCKERIQKKDEDRHEEEERLYDSSRKTLLSMEVQERERGEAGIPVVREEWLLDSIEKQEPQPMEADDVSDLFVEGKGIPWDKQDPEAPNSNYMAREESTKTLNCRNVSNLHLYYKKGKVGSDPNAEERLEEWENAIKESGRLFEELTGNEFEPWEREKKYTMMEMGFDSPDLPMGMLSNFHMERCEEALLWFVEGGKSTKETGQKAEAGTAAFETVRDINVASRLIGDVSGSTLDDPLSDRYKKLGCSVSALKKDSDDYKMIDYGVSVENIFPVEPSACPPLVEIKKLPNKALEVKHVKAFAKKGFCRQSVLFQSPVICSGRRLFVLMLLQKLVIKVESPLEDTKSLEEKKFGVKGLERKTTDESEHFLWKDDIKVPCGRLIPSVHKDCPLEYNEYAIYDPKQTSIRFLMDTAEP
ncbi:hypothetical protein Peur_015112 [Populus x canadensis]